MPPEQLDLLRFISENPEYMASKNNLRGVALDLWTQGLIRATHRGVREVTLSVTAEGKAMLASID